jgi:O-antigen ligase
LSFIKTKIKNIKYIITPIVLAFLPFIVIFHGEKPVPFCVLFLFLSFLFEKNKKLNLNGNNWLLLPFVSYIGIYILFTLISDDILISLKHLERQISILVIPLIIFSSNWSKRRLNIFLETYLIILVVLCLFGFLKLSLFYFIWSDWVEVLSPEYLQFKFPHLLEVHPTYWSYLLIIGNAILLSNNFLKININRYFWIFSLFLFNSCLLFLAARTPVFINFLLIFYSILVFSQTSIKRHAIVVFSLLSFIILVLFVSNFMPYIVAKIMIIPEDERFLLWPTAIEEIKNNYFLWGEGVGHGTELLKNHLSQITDKRVNYNGFDLHNQYLRNYLDMGLLGFLSLTYLVLAPLLTSKWRLEIKNILPLSISLIFVFGMLSESLLSVLKGIVLIAIISPIIMLVSREYH